MTEEQNNFTLFNEDEVQEFADLRVKSVGTKWGEQAVSHEAFNGYAVGFGDAENFYKNILFKYLKIVGDYEGVDYLSGNYEHIKILTEEELRVLRLMRAMVR